MAEQIEWEPLALSLLNLLDKCEIDSEEVTYPIAANIFHGVEMALSIILVMADTINDERQSLILPRPNAMQVVRIQTGARWPRLADVCFSEV